MATLTSRSSYLTLAMAAALMASAMAQETVSATQPQVRIQLHPMESTSLTVLGTPNSLQLVRLNLAGGLIWLQTSETPSRLLDLGRGGHFRYAVKIGAD